MLQMQPSPSLYPAELLDAQNCDSEERRWWVLYTKSNQEKAVMRGLLAREVPFYLPLVTKKSNYRGRIRSSEVPLFSNYVFMYGTPEERVSALETNRISRSLEVADENQLQRDLRQVAQLIACGAPITLEQRMTAGQEVRVKSGRLKGIEGIVLRRRGKSRLLVAVNYLQQGASMEIDDFVLERV